jgi:hypothetical protein
VIRKFYLTGLYVVMAHWVFGQMHDAQWVIGPKTSVLDFRNDTVTIDTLLNYVPFFLTTACISNEEGNLLYSCYGYAVTDRYGATLLNGDSLSPCAYTYQHAGAFQIQQGAIFLPMPGNSRYYYLIHFSNDTLNKSRPGTLYYSVIDKEANFGLGAVVEKNHIFFSKAILRGGGLTACKHANGRDWWFTIGGSNNNRFYTFLLTEEGVSDTLIQDIGPVYSLPFDNSYSCFSEDGSKYVTTAISGYVTVFDFDRCTGTLSSPVEIFNNASTDPISNPISGGTGLAFSSNSRFVYVTNRIVINQYDLWADSTQDSVMIYTADTNDYAQTRFLELASNGKLYSSCWSGGFNYLHIINQPNEKGDSCDFVYAGQPTLSNNSYSLPNMPNYRLGPLLGSGCDTISTSVTTLQDVYRPRLQPNPADKFVYIEMPMQGNYTFDLIDEQGRLIEQRQTRQVDIINTENLPSGTYYLRVRNNGREEITSEKVIVRH